MNTSWRSKCCIIKISWVTTLALIVYLVPGSRQDTVGYSLKLYIREGQNLGRWGRRFDPYIHFRCIKIEIILYISSIIYIVSKMSDKVCSCFNRQSKSIDWIIWSTYSIRSAIIKKLVVIVELKGVDIVGYYHKTYGFELTISCRG